MTVIQSLYTNSIYGIYSMHFHGSQCEVPSIVLGHLSWISYPKLFEQQKFV